MDASASLHAAAISLEITPPIGTRMDGYGARQGASQAVHDPLLATLLVLKGAGGGVALVALDVVAVMHSFSAQVRAALSAALGLPPESILVAASHTHSGPAGYLGRNPLLPSQEDPLLQEMTARQLAGAASWAARSLQPARLSLARGAVREIGRNRNDPDRESDFGVTVLRVDRADGSPLAVWMNYGCHPTVLGPDNLSFSADYPGAARAALRRLYSDTTFLFANGATGDVSTRFTRRGQGFGEVERMGRILAAEVLRLMQVAEPAAEEPLEGAARSLKLPYRAFPPVEEARAQLATLQADLEARRAAGQAHGEIRKAVTRVEGATAQLAMAQAFAGQSGADAEVQRLQIGPLAVIGLPGEPFTQTVLDLKAASPRQPLAVVSYANDYRGYFPDERSVAAGTYEALVSPYDSRASQLLARTALELLTPLTMPS